MTFSAFAGVLFTLALVLALVAVAMRLLRRVTQAAATSRGAVPLQVVQRIALGPRQGIAVVRIGEQLVAVSVGEGGVRTIVELEEADAAATPVADVAPKRDFAHVLRHGLRSAGLPMLMAVLLAAGMPTTTLPAQTSTAAPASTEQAAPRPTQSSGSAVRPRGNATAAAPAAATPALPQIDLRLAPDGNGEGLRLSGTVGVVVMLGLLTLLPALLLLTTSFTRILVVLHFVKQALGTQTTPPAQLLAALALLLTGFVMAPTLSEVNRSALTPWMEGRMEQGEMLSTAAKPLREFMLRQTRERDLEAFVEMSGGPPPARVEDVSTVVLMSAFVTSELRTAFQIGFVLFLPFIIIDIVVSSVLMSMGMFMLPPAMISLPFKLLLFVLVDGWSLLVQSLVAGFR